MHNRPPTITSLTPREQSKSASSPSHLSPRALISILRLAPLQVSHQIEVLA